MRLCSPRHEKDAFRDFGEAIDDAFGRCRILRPDNATPIANSHRESGGAIIDRYGLPPKNPSQRTASSNSWRTRLSLGCVRMESRSATKPSFLGFNWRIAGSRAALAAAQSIPGMVITHSQIFPAPSPAPRRPPTGGARTCVGGLPRRSS
jgi:hypothetical protein